MKAKAGHITNIARKMTRKAGLSNLLSEDIAQEGKLGFILGWNEGEKREAEHAKLKANERPEKAPTAKLEQAMFRANDRMNRAVNKEQSQGRKIGLKTRADIKEQSEARRTIEQETAEPATAEQIAEKTGKNTKLVYSTEQATQAQIEQQTEPTDPTATAQPSPEEIMQTKELESKINTALEKLDLFGDDKKFIARLFGLGGIKKESITALSKEMQTSEDKTKKRRKNILMNLQGDRDLNELIKKSQELMDLFKSALNALSEIDPPHLVIDPIKYQMLRI